MKDRKDRIEEFIQSNRQAFDDESPSPKVWQSIDQELKGKRRNFLWIWQAAAVLFFAMSAFLLVDRIQPGSSHGAEGVNLSQVEDFYFREIRQKRTLIQDMSDTGVSAEAELLKLDAMYLVLKEQFEEKPSQEVLEALTLNLIVRLDLLNQVVADLEKSQATEESRGSVEAKAEI